MNRNGNLDDLDPLVCGFDRPIRRVTLDKYLVKSDPDCVGLDDAGVEIFKTPGFHRQRNGMLAYVPDMKEIDKIPEPEPEEDVPNDPQPEEQLTEGLYLTQREYDGNPYGTIKVRWYDGVYWHNGCSPTSVLTCGCGLPLKARLVSNSPGKVIQKLSISCGELNKFTGSVKELMEMLRTKPQYPCGPEKITKPGFYYTDFNGASNDDKGHTQVKYLHADGSCSNGFSVHSVRNRREQQDRMMMDKDGMPFNTVLGEFVL
jgi:hypothetical protein